MVGGVFCLWGRWVDFGMVKGIISLLLSLIVGCSKPINDDTLIDKDGIKYHPETKEFYSGETTKSWLDEKKGIEGSYKDGELISQKCWDEDGNECECSDWGRGCK